MRPMRLVLTCALAVSVLAVAGCAGQLPPSVRDDPTPPVTAPEGASDATVAPASTATVTSDVAATAAPAAVEPLATTPAESAPVPSSEATQYAASRTDDQVAIGAELQRGMNGKLAARLWVMSADGKADLVGPAPQLWLLAFDAHGGRTLVGTAGTGHGAISSTEGGFTATLPAGTTTLRVETSLQRQGGSGASPRLVIPLAEVPLVTKLTAAGDAR